jgi:hypothetical protein
MAQVQTLTVATSDLERVPFDGEIVRCGPVAAVWQVAGHQFLSGRQVAITLLPFDPHDVPLDLAVIELPRQR